MFQLPIETPLTRLRPVTPDDLGAVHRILGDPETTAPVSFGQPDRDSTAGWIQRRDTQQREHGFSMWAVELVEGGDLIGLCGFFPHDGPDIELGYVVRADHWGQGLATEVVHAVLNTAKDLDITVFATVRSTNVRSLAVARRAGLIETGHIDDDRGRLLVFKTSSALPRNTDPSEAQER